MRKRPCFVFRRNKVFLFFISFYPIKKIALEGIKGKWENIINESFILGAAIFALGHVCFVIAYYFLQRFRVWDLIISGIFFLGAAIFLLFCPLLSFDVPVFKIVYLVYALIISCMLGKALSNFISNKNILFGTIAFASLLFFFSDLMLVFSWFIGLWDWTNEACMGTYYPALCLLALSMVIRIKSKKEA